MNTITKCPQCGNEMFSEAEICPSCGFRNKRKVGFFLWIGIAFFPYIFAWFTLRKGYSTLSRVLSFGWIAFIIFAAVMADLDLKESAMKLEIDKPAILQEVKEKIGNNDYDGAKSILNKYDTFGDEDITTLVAQVDTVLDKEKAKKEKAKKLESEQKDRADAYGAGGLDRDWPMNRECYISVLQDTTGLKTIEKSTALAKNYRVNLYTTNKKVVAKTLWDEKTYKGSHHKTDTMEGFDSLLGESIFDRVYISFLGNVQINIWIAKEPEIRDDLSTYTRIVHHVQIWDHEEGKKMIFECPYSGYNKDLPENTPTHVVASDTIEEGSPAQNIVQPATTISYNTNHTTTTESKELQKPATSTPSVTNTMTENDHAELQRLRAEKAEKEKAEMRAELERLRAEKAQKELIQQQNNMRIGIVFGLDPNGDGFLSIRRKPKSTEIGRLYNGSKVELLDKRGKWYKVRDLNTGTVGWSHGKWISVQ